MFQNLREAQKKDFYVTLRFKPFEQMAAGIFKQVDDELEVASVAVVGVGDDVVVGVALQIVGHHDDFVFGAFGREAEEFFTIAIVHGYDEVEAVEVVCRDGARVVGEVITVLLGVVAHASIGEFSFVIIDDASRVDCVAIVA